MELVELQALLSVLRASGVVEYRNPDGLYLVFDKRPPDSAPPAPDPRARLSEAGRAMADVMDRMGGAYSGAFEVR